MNSVYLCSKVGLPIYHDGWIELPACQLPTGSSVAADRFDTFDGYRALASG
jgi:hypothetical protein